MVSLPPGSRLGRYQMVEGIGRGGMASVYKARDPKLERYVAVQVIPSYHTDDPTFIERFRQEAQAVARLNHPNIIQLHDYVGQGLLLHSHGAHDRQDAAGGSGRKGPVR